MITACFIPITEIDLATFSGSSQSTSRGFPVLTPQNPQDLVQIFPKIMNVAVPSPQHSPIFGQLPEEQIVFSLYLSTRPRRLEYFLPVGSLTLIHLGFFTKAFLSPVLITFLDTPISRLVQLFVSLSFNEIVLVSN